MKKSLNVWQPVGQDVVRDALYGRLGNNGGFGRTVVAGATNAIAVRQQKNQTTLFAGTVNGGIFSRILPNDLEQDDRPQWRWVSNPSNGYSGSQGIGELAVSKNGKWLAVGQGNPSNYSATSTQSGGLAIGALGAKGSIEWSESSREVGQQFNGHNIRSLHWLGSRTLLATSLNAEGGAVIRASLGKKGDFEHVDVLSVGEHNWVSATQDEFSIFAGHQLLDGSRNSIMLARNKDLKKRSNVDFSGSWLNELRGPGYQSLLYEYRQEMATIRRVDVAKKLVDQRLIVFVGLSKEAEDDDYVYRVDRLEIDPETLQVVDGKVFRAEDGEIGTDQASNDHFYGNFSFSVDPRSDNGSGIFLGGNHFGGSPIAAGISYGGGLVYVDFKSNKPVISHRLYGPRIQLSKTGKETLVRPISPGQPHADSRNIAFASINESPILFQVDDGGVWSLPLKNKTGSGYQSGHFWRPLSAPGLMAFEVMMTDWHAQSNGVVASYQDNAASYAMPGESYANNLWAGDGEIAVIDDARNDSMAQAFLSSQKYIADGIMTGLKINNSGFIESYDLIDFMLQDVPGSRPLLWDQTVEAEDPETAPFILPFELNPYLENSIVMAGRKNVYEAVSVDSADYPNSIVFRSLLTPRVDLSITALDNHGDHPELEFQSIYAALLENGHPQIVGRKAGNDNFYLNKTIYSGAKDSDVNIAHGSIVDLAHRPNIDGADDVYWLQGGDGIIHGNQNFNSNLQVLRIKLSTGDLKTFDPSDLGIEIDIDDPFQLQSIVFVPGKGDRIDSLVVSGLTGHWISPLSDEGIPTGFEAMSWAKPYEPESPNVYPTSVKYDPQDDLLIAGTLGKGSWIYPFSRDSTPRPDPKRLLQSSDVNLTQFVEHDLDKRGNQKQSHFTLQIDRRALPDSDQDVNVKLILKDWSQWQRRMEFVSPLFFFTDNDDALKAMNLLESEGVDAFGGKILQGDRVSIPLDFEQQNSIIPMQFLAREFSSPEEDVILRYKVKRQGGSDVSNSKITLARPSRDSTDFEVHGEFPDDNSQIIPGAPPLLRSVDPEGLSISNPTEMAITAPLPQECW